MAQQVAVLVDGENLGAKYAKEILTIAGRHGDPSIVRVYMNAQIASDWHDADGYRMLHSASGKNAADILLAIDAMELLFSTNIRHFVIASSDGDFNHVATRIREQGATVVGVGEYKATSAFRTSCTGFVELGPPKAPCAVSKPKAKVTKTDQKIHEMIKQHSQKGAGMRVAELGSKMGSAHGIKSGTLKEKNWYAYLKARDALYQLDPRGPEAMVRFLPEGFDCAL